MEATKQLEEAYREQLLNIIRHTSVEVDRRRQIKGSCELGKMMLGVAQIFIKNYKDVGYLISEFITRTNSMWVHVKARNADFFGASIMDILAGLESGGVQEGQVRTVVDFLLERDPRTGTFYIDINMYWSLIESMIRIALSWLYANRMPARTAEGRPTFLNPTFMEHIKLGPLWKEWGS
jgi:hypothetical protein